MTNPAAAAIAVLDPANFNVASVTALIEGSALDAATKATLVTAVQAAATNPVMVETVITQVKTALGL